MPLFSRTVGRLGHSLAARNAIALASVQFINLVIPLAILPYVLRILPPSEFGKVVFYQAMVLYFSIVVDFGFQLSATKKISVIRDDRKLLSRYLIAVQSCRIILTVCMMISAGLLFLASSSVRGDGAIYLASLLAMLGTLLTPMWLFSGLERIVPAAITLAAARLCGIPFIFIFVHSAGDGWRFALIHSLSMVGGGLACIFVAMHWRVIERWTLPTRQEIKDAFADAWHYFITVAATTFYTAANPLLLGLVSPSQQVALFGAADRVRMMCLAPLQPVATAYFPVLSRLFAHEPQAARPILRRLFLLVVIGMAIISIFLFASAPLVVDLLMGLAYSEAVPVLRIMSLLPLIVGLNTVLGTLTMLAMGMKKSVSRILLLCGAANLLMIGYFGSAFGARGGAIAIVATETLVALCFSAALFRHWRNVAS